MLKGLLIGAKIAVSLVYDNSIVCGLELLESHSFSQTSEYNEYVCVNVIDRTDFFIVEDKENEMNIGDIMQVKFNEEHNIVEYETLLEYDK